VFYACVCFGLLNELGLSASVQTIRYALTILQIILNETVVEISSIPHMINMNSD